MGYKINFKSPNKLVKSKFSINSNKTNNNIHQQQESNNNISHNHIDNSNNTSNNNNNNQEQSFIKSISKRLKKFKNNNNNNNINNNNNNINNNNINNNQILNPNHHHHHKLLNIEYSDENSEFITIDENINRYLDKQLQLQQQQQQQQLKMSFDNHLKPPNIIYNNATTTTTTTTTTNNISSPNQASSSSGGATSSIQKLKLNLNLSSIKRSCNDADSALNQHSPSTPTSSLRNLFGVATSPRRSSPRAFGNSASSATLANSISLHNLPHRLLDMIFSQVIDYVLPSTNYVEFSLINRQLHRVIDSMRGFALVLGISQSHTAGALRWYQRNHQRVTSLKFVNNFFTQQPACASQLLDWFSALDCSIPPALDFSQTQLTNTAVEFLQQRLLQLDTTRIIYNNSISSASTYGSNSTSITTAIYQLNLANVTFDTEVSDSSIQELTNSLSQCKSIQCLDLSIGIGNSNINSPGNSSAASLNANNLSNSDSATVRHCQAFLQCLPNSLANNQSTIHYLNLGGLNISDMIASQLAPIIRRLPQLQTLIYNNNPLGVHHIVDALTTPFNSKSNISVPSSPITTLNMASCQLFTTPERVTLFQNFLSQNNTITDLNIHSNGFSNNSSREIIDALSRNTSITSIDLSYTAVSHADALLFPLIPSLLNNNRNIKTLLLSNNLPFPEPSSFANVNLCHSDQLTTLSLSSLKLGDEKFAPLIQALSSNQTLTSLDISINRLRMPSALLIADYLEHNRSLIRLNLAYNFLRIGIKKICQALANNHTLRALNLYATQIYNRESKALAKLLRENKTLTELDIGYNMQIDSILDAMCSSSCSILTLNIASNTLKSSFVRLLQRNHTLTSIDISNSSFKISASISNALLKNRSLSKVNFSTKDEIILKLLSTNQKLITKLLPNKYYYYE